MKNFEKGQKVRCIFGRVWTVAAQNECQVFFTCGGWAHPSKVWAI